MPRYSDFAVDVAVGVEADDVAGGAVDGVGAVEAIAVVGVEARSSGGDSTFSACSSGNGGRSAPHLVPLTENDSSSHSTPGAIDEEAVLGDDVEAGIGRRRPEVLLHARQHDVALEDAIVGGARLLVPGDDLADRQLGAAGDVAALGDGVGEAVAEVEDARRRRAAARGRWCDSVAASRLVLIGGRRAPV